jgi:dihydrodipicolinate reductase
MIRIILSGCCGRMGQVLSRMIDEREDMTVVCGFDMCEATDGAFPIYASPDACMQQADVVIDFSNSAVLNSLLPYCVSQKLPLVLCTTGFSEAQLVDLDEAAKQIPLFRSGNMSLGINVVMDFLRRTATLLGDDFDVEIVERHHKKKLDAPSGTALMLADAVAEGLPHESDYIFERESRRQERNLKELGISAVRGGTIVGEHTVIFAGHDEVIEITHKAYSREIFAKGALDAARYLAGKPAGHYNMSDMLQA